MIHVCEQNKPILKDVRPLLVIFGLRYLFSKSYIYKKAENEIWTNMTFLVLVLLKIFLLHACEHDKPILNELRALVLTFGICQNFIIINHIGI